MNKSELVDQMAHDAGISKDAAKKALDSFLAAVEKTIASNQKVTITGFGTFEARETKEREGRNPKTGEMIKIPAGRRPAFKAGKVLKDALK